jgi:hypothetical protein
VNNGAFVELQYQNWSGEHESGKRRIGINRQYLILIDTAVSYVDPYLKAFPYGEHQSMVASDICTCRIARSS